MLLNHKKLLQANNYYLLSNLSIKDENFINVLKNSKILLPTHIDTINGIQNVLKKVEKFLDIIPKRGSKAFDLFLEALDESNQNYISEKLKICLNGKVPNTADPPDSVDNVLNPRLSNPDDKLWILIINNNKFKDKYFDRDGSLEDVSNLKEFFVSKLKYKLFESGFHSDLTVEEMRETITRFIDHISSLNCAGKAIVVLMSHGKHSYISGIDEELLEIRAVFSDLNRLDKNVFKMIVFSCCRGERDVFAPRSESEEGYGNAKSFKSNANDAELIRNKLDEPQYYNYNRVCGYQTPMNSVVLYSTQEHHVSIREDFGTIFIQAMLSVFKKHYQRESIRTMVMKIRDEMSTMFPAFNQIPDIKENYFTDFYL